ncbi:MAG: hypothetical protein ACE5D4_03690 [Thermodesulfobacteriota bacterium]
MFSTEELPLCDSPATCHVDNTRDGSTAEAPMEAVMGRSVANSIS